MKSFTERRDELAKWYLEKFRSIDEVSPVSLAVAAYQFADTFLHVSGADPDDL